MRTLRAHCTYIALACTVFGGTHIAFAGTSPEAHQKILALTSEAHTAYTAGKFAIAEQKYAEAVSLTSSSTSAKSRIALLSNLGAAYREDHKYPEAEDAFKQALVIADAAHLNYDYSAKLTMQQYAMLLRKMKRMQEADSMDLRAAAGIPEKTVAAIPPEGTKAPNTVTPEPEKELHLHLEVAADYKEVSVEEIKRRVDKDPQNWHMLGTLGVKYVQANQFVEAAEQFKLALRYASDASKEQRTQLRWFMAEAYMKADQPQEALDGFRQLCADNPDQPRFLLAMAACYDMLGDMSSELAALQLHMERWPNDAHHAVVAENVERLRRDVEKTAGQAQLGNQPTNDELRKSFIRAKMPLKVWINDKDEDKILLAQGHDSSVTENTPGLLLQRAMEQWTQASQGRITFSLVPNSADADITCEYTDDPNGLESESALGITIPHVQAGERHTMEIKILVVSPKSGDPLDRAEFAQAAVHEFGHALGLDHSDHAGDVMYRTIGVKPIVYLTDNDKDRILKLYTYTP